MPKKRPHIARLDQANISRDGEDATIEFLDPAISTTHLRIGPQLQQMTDEEILLMPSTPRKSNFLSVLLEQDRDRGCCRREAVGCA
jgi:hypothetical protein